MRTRDAAVERLETPQQPLRAGLALEHERLASPERVLLPADRPRRARLHRADRRGQILAVQRIPCLGAQRVTCAETGRQATERTGFGHERVPERRGVVPPGDQLVPVLAGVAGTADPHRCAAELGVGVGHVVEFRGEAERAEHVGRARALDGEHGEVAVLVGHGDRLGCRCGQPAHHLGGVRGVRDEEDLVVADQVGDQVVDDATGLVAAQGVLRLAGRDAPEVVRQAPVDELARAGPADGGLAEVRHVEDPDRLTHRGVLLQHATAACRVLDRHLPTAEVGELRAESDVPVVQR